MLYKIGVNIIPDVTTKIDNYLSYYCHHRCRRHCQQQHHPSQLPPKTPHDWSLSPMRRFKGRCAHYPRVTAITAARERHFTCCQMNTFDEL